MFLALVPLYGIMQSLGLLNSYVGLIIVYVAYSLPFSVFFLTAFFETLPRSIAEAALIDGASHYGVFFRVMVPMARPGLISVGTFNFVGQWNQFLLPLVLITDPNKFLLSQGIANLAVSQNYNSSYTVLFAALVLTMIPLVVVYVLVPAVGAGRHDGGRAEVAVSACSKTAGRCPHRCLAGADAPVPCATMLWSDLGHLV